MTTTFPAPGSGLTADELARALDELRAMLTGAEIADVAVLDARDDLLVFAATATQRHALHLAPGGRRARVTLTNRRFPRHAFATGPRVDRLVERLRGAHITTIAQRPGERAFTIRVERDAAVATLECELFGNRGLWALCDAESRVVVLSRLPNVAGRPLRPGEPWIPPPPRATEPAPGAVRFSAPVLSAIDAAYTALDLELEATADREELARVLTRETNRRTHRVAGLERQLAAVDDVDAIRHAADALMAYGFGLPPEAAELRAPHPIDADREIVVPRDTAVPPHVQAQTLYKRARKLSDSRATAEQQLADARDALADIVRLSAEHPLDDSVVRAALRAELERRRLLTPQRSKPLDVARQRIQKATGGENFRHFRSIEDLSILVGRDDRQNDRLSTRIARGNDVWLHVGRGYAGSHVVIRVPKGRSPSLESLLDAATLAIHFSKVRGATLEEVVYTAAKNVRKAKGMPAGKVIATQTRSLRVRLEPDRLRRLLDSQDSAESPR